MILLFVRYEAVFNTFNDYEVSIPVTNTSNAQIKVFANEIKYCYFGFGAAVAKEGYKAPFWWNENTSKRMITPCRKGDWKLYIAFMKICDVCSLARRGKYMPSWKQLWNFGLIYPFLTIGFRLNFGRKNNRVWFKMILSSMLKECLLFNSFAMHWQYLLVNSWYIWWYWWSHPKSFSWCHDIWLHIFRFNYPR